MEGVLSALERAARWPLALVLLAVVSVTGAVLTGCGRDKKSADTAAVAFGDPVGVRVEAPSDPSSFVEAAFALPVGNSPDRLVPAMARALHGAAKACPAIVPLTKRGDILRFHGRIEAGLLQLDDDPAAGAEAKCARATMIGQRMQEDGDPPLAMMIEIAARSAKGTP